MRQTNDLQPRVKMTHLFLQCAHEAGAVAARAESLKDEKYFTSFTHMKSLQLLWSLQEVLGHGRCVL